MRKEFILYLVAISFFSLFFSILSSPLSEMIGIENKIITIDKENNKIYLTNKYGTFKATESDWLDRKENVTYKDTVTYRFLFTFATDEKTIKNINKDAKLTDFEIYIGKKTIIWRTIVILFTAIFLMVSQRILYYLYKFLETFLLTLIKKRLLKN